MLFENAPKESEFNFKSRLQVLVDKWNKPCATDSAPAAEANERLPRSKKLSQMALATVRKTLNILERKVKTKNLRKQPRRSTFSRTWHPSHQGDCTFESAEAPGTYGRPTPS